jgi:hypothetical protein
MENQFWDLLAHILKVIIALGLSVLIAIGLATLLGYN